MKATEVTAGEAARLILTQEPRGLFYVNDSDRYIGIDNSTGYAWTEEFQSLDECLAWLEGGQA